MKVLRFIFLTSALMGVILCSGAFAQDDEDIQSWNDVQLNVPMSKQVDFFVKLTMRVGNNVSRLNDGRFAIGYVWKPTPSLSISPFYWYIKARNSAGDFVVENRLNVSATYKFPVKKFGLSHRSTFEKRLRQPVSTWRYRAMITVDKEFPKKVLSKAKWFISDEVFYDSATGRFSRNRFSVGITKTISKNLSVDLYYTRQNDGFAHPGDLNIFWQAWKIRL